MKALLASCFLALLASASAQTPIYSETWDTSGTDIDTNYADWTETNVNTGGGAPDATVVDGILSSTIASGEDGYGGAYFNLPAGFTLNGQSGLVAWAPNLKVVGFNISKIRGLSGGNSETNAFLWLGGTSTNLLEGDGYFVALTDTDSFSDRLVLYGYSGGIEGTLTEIVLGTTNYNADDEVNVKVTFNPTSGAWELFSSLGWIGDPASLDGANSEGGASNATYADTTLVASGIFAHGFAGGGASGRGAEFDNVSMTTDGVLPEPEESTLQIVEVLADIEGDFFTVTVKGLDLAATYRLSRSTDGMQTFDPIETGIVPLGTEDFFTDFGPLPEDQAFYIVEEE